MTTMTAERVRTLLAAYGADPARWPEGERDSALVLMSHDPALAAEVAEAAELDSLLDVVPAPAPSPALRVRLKEIPDRASLGWAERLRSLWPFDAPWRPAAGLVAAALVGVVVGIATPEPTTADSAVSSTFVYEDDPVADAAALASGAGSLESFQ